MGRALTQAEVRHCGPKQNGDSLLRSQPEPSHAERCVYNSHYLSSVTSLLCCAVVFPRRWSARWAPGSWLSGSLFTCSLPCACFRRGFVEDTPSELGLEGFFWWIVLTVSKTSEWQDGSGNWKLYCTFWWWQNGFRWWWRWYVMRTQSWGQMVEQHRILYYSGLTFRL